VLVAPVVEQGATSRKLYLPRGIWHDFWTGDRQEGGREISREVDLGTTPLYVRAGGIVPLDPVRQYADERVDGPLTVNVYPGLDGSFLLYDDDGKSFAYRKGAWMGIQMAWNDGRRTLSMRLAPGSRMLGGKRAIEVKAGGSVKQVEFVGKAVEVRL